MTTPTPALNEKEPRASSAASIEARCPGDDWERAVVRLEVLLRCPPEEHFTDEQSEAEERSGRDDTVMAVLIGLMLGSLRVLWPWPGGVESTELAAPGTDGGVLVPVMKPSAPGRPSSTGQTAG